MKYQVNEPRRGSVSHIVLGTALVVLGSSLGAVDGLIVAAKTLPGGVTSSAATVSAPDPNFNILTQPPLRGVPLTGSLTLQPTTSPQPAAGSGWIQEPEETAYLPALNASYNGPALVAH